VRDEGQLHAQLLQQCFPHLNARAPQGNPPLLHTFQFSGEYSLLLFTVGLIFFDHFMEKRVRRDLHKLITIKKSLEKIKDD